MRSIHTLNRLCKQRLKLLRTMANHTKNSLERTPKVLQLLSHAFHSKSIRKEKQLSRPFHIPVPDYIQFPDCIDL